MEFTATQEKTLEFLDRMESKEVLGDSRTYSCVCKTCDVREVLHSAGTVSALFMTQHAGHITWVKLN